MVEVKCAHDEMVPVEKLVPNPRNPNKHPAKQIELLAKIIGAQGWRAPVSVSRLSGFIVRGHGRYEAALKMGCESVPVDFQDYGNEAEEWADLIADNRIAELASIDEDELTGILQEMHQNFKDFDLTLTGVEDIAARLAGADGAGDAPEPQIDRAEELQKEWKTATGQVWEIGKHRVMCGDTSVDLPTLMSGSLGHLIFTDPPYGVGYDGGAKKREKLTGDHIGTDIYTETLPSLASAVDNEAALYLWYADGHAAAAAAAAAGYQIVAQIIWAKNHAQFVTSAHYKGKHEPCYYGHKRGHSARWHGPNNEVTLWEYDRSACNEFHPTQKPVAVALRAVKNSTKPGQIVVDGFLGGGTTLVAAEQTGRICYGMEIDPKYVAVTLQRMADMGLKPELTEA